MKRNSGKENSSGVKKKKGERAQTAPSTGGLGRQNGSLKEPELSVITEETKAADEISPTEAKKEEI